MVHTSWVEHIPRSKRTQMTHTSWVEHLPRSKRTQMDKWKNTTRGNVNKLCIHTRYNSTMGKRKQMVHTGRTNTLEQTYTYGTHIQGRPYRYGPSSLT